MINDPLKDKPSPPETGKYLILLLMLLLISAFSGYLMSMPSLIGRVGMDIFYKEYHFLATWWKGALSVFIVLFLLLLIQGMIQYKLRKGRAILLQALFLLLAIAGFIISYNDFHSERTHRWLKDRFHIGVYLFWLGCALVSIFYLLSGKKKLLYEDKRGHPGIPANESRF
jgi:hypothetical protein